MTELGKKLSKPWQQLRRHRSISKNSTELIPDDITEPKNATDFNEDFLEWEMNNFSTLQCDPMAFEESLEFETGGRSRCRSNSFYEDNDDIVKAINDACSSGDEGDKGYLPNDMILPAAITPLKCRESERRNVRLSFKEVEALKEGLITASGLDNRVCRKVSSDYESDDFSPEPDENESAFDTSSLDGSKSRASFSLKDAYASLSWKARSVVKPNFDPRKCDNLMSGQIHNPSRKNDRGHRNYNRHRPHRSENLRKIKILMLGDTGVGKSSLIQRFTDDTFHAGMVGTVGVDFKIRTMEVLGEKITVQVWDTAGQERFHKITRAYYHGCQGILLAYDVGEPGTLENISYWIKNIRDNASKDVRTCLVGNKADLKVRAISPYQLNWCVSASPQGSGRKRSWECPPVQVETESGQQIAEEYGVNFFEASAKTGYNVNEAFLSLLEGVVRNQRAAEEPASSSDGHKGSNAVLGFLKRRAVDEQSDGKESCVVS
uniref:Rab8 family GTPase n=1 Tax=Vaucheria litorea TaxID=109269 RepID=H6WB87_VAULI|nr:Rab8 family GTPase [Vaucheria litorea]